MRAGYPVVDLRVTLTDGKAHAVDSSDMAFQMAGALALREAATSSSVTLLEPYDAVTVVIPDDLVGGVMSDLSARRGRLLGTDKVGDDRTLVRAEVPQTELTRYAIDLRSATHGSGIFTRCLRALRADARGGRPRGRRARLPRLTRRPVPAATCGMVTNRNQTGPGLRFLTNR